MTPLQPAAHLTIGVLGQTDRARLRDTLESRGDIDAVTHQIAVALLDDVTEMDADPKFDALVGCDLSVALDHRPLNFNGAVHCVDDAAELDDTAVASSLDDAPMVDRDGRIDQVAAKRPKSREDSDPRRHQQAANSRRRRTPRSRPVFGSRPRRYAATTVSAVSDRPGKASEGHRKDARGMSLSWAWSWALSVSRLGQGQAREAGTESSGVSGISLSRADTSISQFASPRRPTARPRR